MRFLHGTALACVTLATLPAGVFGQTPSPSVAPSRATPQTVDALIDAGRFAEADALARRNLAAAEASGRDGAEAAVALADLARAQHAIGKDAESAVLMRRVFTIRERIGPPEETAQAANRLAIALGNDPRESETFARRAIALAEPLNNPGLLSAAYSTLGTSLNLQRRFPEADAAHRRALEIARGVLGDDHPRVAGLYTNVAVNLQDMGRVAEAEEIFRRNSRIIAAAYGPDNPETARAYDVLAANLLAQNKLAEAETAARAALTARERSLGPDSPQTLNSYETLANILIQQRKLPDAERIARLLVDKRGAGPDVPATDLVADQGRLGQVLFAQRRFADAVPYQRRAIAIARERLGPRHPLLAYGLVSLSGSVINIDPRDEEPVTLIREAVELVRSDRARALSARGAGSGQRALARALGGNQAAGDLAKTVNGLWLLVTEARSLQFPAEAPRLRAETFLAAQDLAQSAAGRAMAQTAARQAAGTGELATLVRRQQDLATRARAQNEALIAALGGDAATEARLRTENERIGEELAEADGALRRAFPAYAEMIAPKPLTEAAVQQRLRPGEGLLLIVDAGNAMFSFAVSRDSAVRAAAKLDAAQIRALSARIRCNVDPVTCPGGTGTATAEYDRAAAFQLYQALVQPVEAALRDVKTLYVTTTGPLADTPFAALLTAPPAGAQAPLANAPWLGDRYAVVTLPAVSALHASPRTRATARRADDPFVGYGAPSLAAPDVQRGPVRGTVRSAQGQGAGLADPAMVRTMPSLPGTEVELKAMARALSAPPTMVRLGAQATEAAVRSDPALADARVVAFATHGLLPGDLDGMVEPGLVFTPPAAASQQDDGVLDASEAAGLRLSADWVILSACNTASPEGGNGSDSLSALARAFLYAGADSLLASHWRIGDDVTAALTVETLADARRNPRAGRAAALQAAMRAVRTGRRADGSAIAGWNADWSHPAAWAPFSLISDGD